MIGWDGRQVVTEQKEVGAMSTSEARALRAIEGQTVRVELAAEPPRAREAS